MPYFFEAISRLGCCFLCEILNNKPQAQKTRILPKNWMFDRIKYFTFGWNPIGIRRIESKWSVKHTMQRLITIGYWNGFDRDDQCICESSDEFVCIH